MKKIIFALFCSLLLHTNSTFAQESSSIIFVKTMTDEIITNVLKSSDTQELKTERFEKYFLNALDTKSIGKFVLGKHARKISDEELKKFTLAFTTMALKSWADKFSLYTGQSITFQGERPAEGKNQVYVDSLIQNGANPVQVIWRLKVKNEDYKIVDIVIEGVSMVLTYRDEYASFLDSHTLEELIQKLNSQAETFVPTKNK